MRRQAVFITVLLLCAAAALSFAMAKIIDAAVPHAVGDTNTTESGEAVEAEDASDGLAAVAAAIGQTSIEQTAIERVDAGRPDIKKPDDVSVTIEYADENFDGTANGGKRYSVRLDKASADYDRFADAVKLARAAGGAEIVLNTVGEVVWKRSALPATGATIYDVPLISQLPELFRGCEVTSLCMLLNYLGADVDKLELANGVKKDPAKYEYKDGKVYFGDPNTGFVGDMVNAKNNGLGVYHAPIYALLRKYFPDTAIDMTGCEFDDVKKFLQKGCPVWVIINSRFERLPASEFETWGTAAGDIVITYKEHSVLITGYDEQYVYYNDPYGYENKAEVKNFVDAWEQMGRQAVTAVRQ